MPKVPYRYIQNPVQKIVENMKLPGDIQRAEPIQRPADVPGERYRTEIYTYFTIPDGQTKLLYSADRWVKIQLTLEDAGPVAVSTREDISPVLSGKGILLVTSREVEFTLPQGNRLFIAATAVNRVSYITEPIPWFQSVIYNIKKNTAEVTSAIKALRGR